MSVGRHRVEEAEIEGPLAFVVEMEVNAIVVDKRVTPLAGCFRLLSFPPAKLFIPSKCEDRSRKL